MAAHPNSADSWGSNETPLGDVEHQLRRLSDQAHVFARLGINDKVRLLEATLERVAGLAERWARMNCAAKRIDFDRPVSGEAWFLGPGLVLRNLRQLATALKETAERGAPKTGPARRLHSGQVAVRVFPQVAVDRLLVPGVSAETRFLPGVTRENLQQYQASFYQRREPEGAVALVLGAGNVSSIPVMDVLYKLFVEGRVCLLKMNPVNDYLGPVIEQGLAPLIERGFLALCYGGADLGAHVIEHELVDEVHMTGSTRTHDRIVWGPEGPERAQRLKANKPLLTKPMTSELGNISPVLIVPGRFSDRELAAMADQTVGMLAYNAGFNCNAAKLLVTSKHWPQRDQFLHQLGILFEKLPRRFAYYPGAREAYARFTRDRDDLREYRGRSDIEGSLPWGLVCGLDPAQWDDLAFREEAFCSVLAEVCLPAQGSVEFVQQAVRFANDTLWGTLNAMLFACNGDLKDAAVSEEIETAITDLRYGTVALNQWSALGYALGTTPWGGHPTTGLRNIQSGHGWVHNTPMFEGIEKGVVRGPLIPLFKPLWSPTHETAHVVARQMCSFEATQRLSHLTLLGVSAFRG